MAGAAEQVARVEVDAVQAASAASTAQAAAESAVIAAATLTSQVAANAAAQQTEAAQTIEAVTEDLAWTVSALKALLIQVEAMALTIQTQEVEISLLKSAASRLQALEGVAEMAMVEALAEEATRNKAPLGADGLPAAETAPATAIPPVRAKRHKFL